MATYLPMRAKSGRKSSSHRTPAQKAATKRMLAGLAASRRGTKGRKSSVHRAKKRSNAPYEIRRAAKGGRFVKAGGQKVTSLLSLRDARDMASARRPKSRKSRKSPKRKNVHLQIHKSTKTGRFTKVGGALVGTFPRRANGKRRSSGGKRRSNGKVRTREVLVHRTKHMRNPVGFDHADGLMRLGTWGKVGIGVLFGLAGLAVAFGVPKGLAMVTGSDAFQRGWGGVATSAISSIAVGLAVSFLSKRASLGLLTAAGVGVALLAINALSPSVAQMVIPLNEATLAAMLPTFDGATTNPNANGSAPTAAQIQLLTQANTPNPTVPGMNVLGLPMGTAPAPASAGMGMVFYPAAPGMGYYPASAVKPTYYPAGMGGYNAPASGSVATPNAAAYERAAGQVGGPQGYNPPAAGAISAADVSTIRYSPTTKEKF